MTARRALGEVPRDYCVLTGPGVLPDPDPIQPGLRLHCISMLTAIGGSFNGWVIAAPSSSP